MNDNFISSLLDLLYDRLYYANISIKDCLKNRDYFVAEYWQGKADTYESLISWVKQNNGTNVPGADELSK